MSIFSLGFVIPTTTFFMLNGTVGHIMQSKVCFARAAKSASLVMHKYFLPILPNVVGQLPKMKSSLIHSCSSGLDHSIFHFLNYGLLARHSIIIILLCIFKEKVLHAKDLANFLNSPPGILQSLPLF